MDRRRGNIGFCWIGSLSVNRLSSPISPSPSNPPRDVVRYTTTCTNTRKTDFHFSNILRQPRAATKSRHYFSVRRAFIIFSSFKANRAVVIFLACTSTRSERIRAEALEPSSARKEIVCLITHFRCSREYFSKSKVRDW